MNFLRLQTGDYFLLQTSDKLLLAGGVAPEPVAAFPGAAYIAAARMRAARKVAQVEAMLMAFLNAQD